MLLRRMKMLDQGAALNAQVYVEEGVAGGQGGAAVFEKGEANKVVAGDGDGGFTMGRDADDAALAVKTGCYVEIIVHVEGHALGAAKALIEHGGVAVAVDSVDGLV